MRSTRQPGPDFPAADFQDAQRDAHALVAREQSAIFSAQIAIARWTSKKKDTMNTAPPAREPARARWYAQAEKNFQEWLKRGGFSQGDDAVPAVDLAPAFTPLSDSVRKDADQQDVDAFVN